MLHKSLLTTISLGIICLQFCQAVPVNSEDLASAFQEFSKKAVAEILSQKRHLEELEQAIGPFIGQLNNGTNSKDTNVENIQVIARDIQSLRAAVEANERGVAETRMATSQCGGFIPLESKEELLYEIPPGIHYVNCIWVLWAKQGGPIRVKNEPNSNAQFDISFKLVAVHNFRADGIDQTILPSGSEEMLGVNGSAHTFAVLFFQANVTTLGQGFHLKFEDNGATEFINWAPNFKHLSLSKSNGTLKYPSGLSYEDNERVFAIGQVPEGKSMNLRVESLNTERSRDWFRFMWLDSSLFSRRYSSGLSLSALPLIPGGCSYIILFVSDESVTNSGIQMSYNVYESNVM